MSEPGGDPSSGISLGDVLRLPKRHPACRRREAQLGSCTERENLAGDAKGKGTSGSIHEAESTDALERGGLLRSSYEAGVMLAERRGRSSPLSLNYTQSKTYGTICAATFSGTASGTPRRPSSTCCDAWNALMAQSKIIASIGTRD